MLFVRLNQGIGPHQAALADSMYKLLGDDFVFIEFGRKQEFQKGSYTGMSQGVDYYADRPYILRMNDTTETARQAQELINKADVLHTGGEPLELTRDRIHSKKLTFRSSERLFKIPIWKNLGGYRYAFNIFSRFSNSNYRVLCQSGYLPNDLAWCPGNYKNKCYKFAYFTEIPELELEQVFSNRSKDKIRIVWCARFIDWKHPELPVLLAQKLVLSGRVDFEIQMIGADTTPMWKDISAMVSSYHLEDYVKLTGGLPNTEVKKIMRDSHVFIFTSDRQEGWGAVLNEAMGSGCACVASNEIGAVPYLLKNNVNGLIFKSQSVDSLFDKVAILYDKPEMRERIGKEAYKTITTDWSARLAAERLVLLSESILSGNETSFDDGPCSKAYPIATFI